MKKAVCLLLSCLIIFEFHRNGALLAQADNSEAGLGRKFSLFAQSQLPVVRHYTVQRYIQRLGQRIVARLEEPAFPYQFSVIQEPHLNAFSVPGGYIYFHSGLILRVDSDDELASVLGHEIAHVQGHHMVRQQEDTKLLGYAGIAAMVLALVNPVLAAGASSAAQATQSRYQRQLEEEADYRGLQYMRQAGFNPHAMPIFLKKMQQEERLSVDQVPPYFRSHPMSQERLSYIERTLRTMQWNQTEPTDTFELRRVQAILRTLQEPRNRLITEYEQRVKEHPDDPKALAILGTVFLSYNDWERARQTLEQAAAKGIRLDRELGLAYLRLKQPDRARQAFLRQVEIDPSDADAHHQLCSLSFQANEIVQAEQECRTAIQLDPRLDEAYVTFAQVADRQGRSGEARLLLAQGMELQGRLEAASGQYQRAAHALGPDHPQAEEIARRIQQLEEMSRELGQMRRR